tara:strand:- start:4262 stop:5887 length:1626 start_codon:yes stop_codon:yes gene_type:complete
LGWVRLAEALAAPKGLIARGVRAAQRWQLSSAAEDRKEEALAAKREAEEVTALVQGLARDEEEAAEAATVGPDMATQMVQMGFADDDAPSWEFDQAAVGPQPAALTEQAPLPEPGRFSKGSLDPIWAAEKKGAAPKELLESFGGTYVNTLLARLKHDDARDKATRSLEEIGMLPSQAGGALATSQPEPEKAPAGYRAARRAQDESQAARAKEVEDYAADMSLSTIEEVYNDFSKFASGHEGPMGPRDFADFYEQLKFITDRDPALVEGLALDPVGTKRQILRDAMSYFKFLNMGGDPKAAERRAEQDKNLKLRNKALEDAAKKRAAKANKALTRKGYSPTRGAPANFFDWKDDLNAWANKVRYPKDKDFADIPSYLNKVGDRPGSAINAVRHKMVRELKEEWGEKDKWSRSQNKVWKSLQKALEGHRTVIAQAPVKSPSPPKRSAEERRYIAAKTKLAGEAAARKAEEDRYSKLTKKEKGNQEEAHLKTLSGLKRKEASAEAVLNQALLNLKESDPDYFGGMSGGEDPAVTVPPGFKQRQD